jgi:TRAP-type C4-dicarboxylate transport system permease small subunit
VLLILTAVAPIALACHALPHTDGAARLWWRSFIGCLTIPVLQALTLTAGQWMLLDLSTMLPLLGIPGDPAGIVNLLVVVVLLWTTLRIPTLVRTQFVASHSGRGGAQIMRIVVVQQGMRLLGVRR